MFPFLVFLPLFLNAPSSLIELLPCWSKASIILMLKSILFKMSSERYYLSLHVIGENMLRYLSADMVSSEKGTVFRERSSRKTVSFQEKILSWDKYPSIVYTTQVNSTFRAR